jgi:hypothetical protein
MDKNKGGRPPLPLKEKKQTVPLRLYGRTIDTIRPRATAGMQAWIEDAIYEKMKRDGVSVTPSPFNP